MCSVEARVGSAAGPLKGPFQALRMYLSIPWSSHLMLPLPLESNQAVGTRNARSSVDTDGQYALNNPPSGWTHATGFVTREMIEAAMPSGGVGSAEHGKGGKVLLCGPPPMINAMK